MPNNADPKVAIVTGAGKRIGRAIAIALSEQGYDIAVHYRSSATEAEDTAKRVRANGVRAALVSGDLSSKQDAAKIISSAADALGPITLLVNCASVFDPDELGNISEESWDKHINTNLYAPIKLAQDFADQAPQGANALVVNIIDQRVLKLTPRFFSYTLSKAALWTATQTMAQALGPKNIRVNGIAPGPILKNPRQTDEDWRKQNEATILGRGASPDDISAAVLYLVSARSVTGQLISVDGGQHLAWQTPDAMVGE